MIISPFTKRLVCQFLSICMGDPGSRMVTGMVCMTDSQHETYMTTTMMVLAHASATYRQSGSPKLALKPAKALTFVGFTDHMHASGHTYKGQHPLS